MKTIKTTKAKAVTTPNIAAQAVPVAGRTPAPTRKSAAKTTAAQAPVAPAAPRTATPIAPITDAPRREITADVIAARAYTLWEQQGRPHGQDLANWLQAERQLKEEIQSFTA